MKEQLVNQVQNLTPVNAQEETDRKTILAFLESADDISIRQNLVAHLTASAWVVTPDRQKVLMAYHRLYDSWAWLPVTQKSSMLHSKSACFFEGGTIKITEYQTRVWVSIVHSELWEDLDTWRDSWIQQYGARQW